MRSRSLLPLFASAFFAVTSGLAASLSGCAMGDGDPFATVKPTLAAEIHFHEEDMTQDGWLALEEGGLLKVEQATLTVSEVRVLASSADSSVTAFDPAHPPEGYTLCHGGHCHATDGSVKSYAEIEAELLGGNASALSTALTLSAADPLNLLDEEAVALTCPDDERGACALDEVKLQRVELAAAHLFIAGQYRASEEAAAVPVSLAIDLNPEREGLFTHALSFKAKRTGKQTFRLDLGLEISCDVLGEIDWESASPDLAAFKHEFSESAFLLGDEEAEEGHEHHHDHEHEHGDEDEDHDHEHEHEGEDHDHEHEGEEDHA